MDGLRERVSFLGQVDAEASTTSASSSGERKDKHSQNDVQQALQPSTADEDAVNTGADHPVTEGNARIRRKTHNLDLN